jgi:RimJ/RimL family protein N-acetyltransferase
MNTQFSKTIVLQDGRSVLLRTLQSDDAQRLLDFINPIIREPARILLNKELTIAFEETYVRESLLSIEKADLIKILGVYGEQVIASVDVKRQRDKMSHIGLLGISIQKDFRGVGLGRILIEEVIGLAKSDMKLKKIILSANKENTAAVSLYKKMGFTQYGELVNAVFHDGKYEDELFFYKNL